MSDYEEALGTLRRIEANQQSSLKMQAEQLAVVKAQMERTEARVQESIALQKVANARQAKALNILLPVIVLAMLYVGYLLFKHAQGHRMAPKFSVARADACCRSPAWR